MAATLWSWLARSWRTFGLMPSLLIVAGDPSADRHGAALAKALRLRIPGLRLSALGGSHLSAAVDDFLYPLVNVGGFGFWEPLLKIPQLWRIRNRIRRFFDEHKPDAVVPIDYYGFNIHVAREAKK